MDIICDIPAQNGSGFRGWWLNKYDLPRLLLLISTFSTTCLATLQREDSIYHGSL